MRSPVVGLEPVLEVSPGGEETGEAACTGSVVVGVGVAAVWEVDASGTEVEHPNKLKISANVKPLANISSPPCEFNFPGI